MQFADTKSALRCVVPAGRRWRSDLRDMSVTGIAHCWKAEEIGKRTVSTDSTPKEAIEPSSSRDAIALVRNPQHALYPFSHSEVHRQMTAVY